MNKRSYDKLLEQIKKTGERIEHYREKAEILQSQREELLRTKEAFEQEQYAAIAKNRNLSPEDLDEILRRYYDNQEENTGKADLTPDESPKLSPEKISEPSPASALYTEGEYDEDELL